jgi:hypothetical protein
MKLLTAALLAGGLLAMPAPAKADKVAAKHPGTLHVYDGGHLFSAAGADRAKNALNNTQFSYGLSVTVDTHEKIPDAKKGEYKDDAKAAFFRKWAEESAKGDRAHGVYILICRSPGYVEVIADKPTRDRGFSNENERKLRDIFLGAFKDSKAAKEAGKSDEEQVRIRDEALLGAVGYITTDLKDTSVVVPTTGKGRTTSTTPANTGGRSVMGWIWIGLGVLLVVWLVVGIIRMFTSPAGYYGGGGYGGGGYGGGGGGFFSGLVGGMFGAMAGMWMYNNMFGGHSYGNDAYANDYGNSGTEGTAPGDGDFSGDTGAGGSYDDGGTGGGGDYGGGGDFGGGGDYGGGGDFGGGGGGGDFGGDF